MHARVAAWAETLPASEELGRALEAVARGELERLAADPRPLTDRLPPAIAAALEQGITDSLPGIVERIGDALERPESRTLVLRIIRQGPKFVNLAAKPFDESFIVTMEIRVYFAKSYNFYVIQHYINLENKLEYVHRIVINFTNALFDTVFVRIFSAICPIGE